MKSKFFIFLIFLWGVQSVCAQPDTFSGLKLWLNADSGLTLAGNQVVQWDDQSASGYSFLQGNASLQPTKVENVLNGHSAIVFDGTNDYLDGGNILSLGTKSHSIFVVGFTNSIDGTFFSKSLAGDNSGRFCLYFYTNNINFLYQDDGYRDIWNPSQTNKYLIWSIINNRTSNSNSIYENGALLFSKAINGSFDMSSSFNFLVGAYNNSLGTTPPAGIYLNGKILDIIIYDTLLNPIQKNEVETYLMNKYAPPVALGSDVIIAHGLCPYKISSGKGYTSYLWSTESTADSILVSQSGDYWVQVTDIFGRISRDTVHVQYPYTALPDRGLCILDTITANTGLDHTYTFTWSDASTDSLLRIWNLGTYWVEITDSTLAACSVRDTFVVAADSFAVHASLGPDIAVCSGDKIGLVAGMEGGIDYNWNTGYTGSQLLINSAGTYWLEATNVSGCVAHDTIGVSIKGIRPVSAFTASTACKGDSTSLFDFSYTVLPDEIAAWNWDFADSGTSLLKNPKHVFPTAGDFMVNLQVTSDSGCVADTAISIHVRELPKADFMPHNGCNGQNISFHDNSESGEGSLASWNWKFGDGNTDNEQNPAYIYSDTGHYTVNLFVQDIYGCTDSLKRTMTIHMTPEADFNVEESCLGGLTVFSETTVMPFWAGIIRRKWDFGDNSISTSKTPTHIYNTAGIYNVLLVNQSVNGCIDSISKQVKAHSYPVAGFISDVACEGHQVCFTDTSIVQFDSIDTWNWTFDEKITDTVAAPCIVFANTGTYHVSLRVSSDFGCSSYVNDNIVVHNIPSSDFSLSPEYGNSPLNVQFYNYTIGAVSQNWFFGDNGFSSSLNPQHIYTQENVYNVILVSKNEFGCTDTASANVYVIPSILDLVLIQLTVVDSGGYLYLKTRFFNNGTRNIRKIALDARVGNNIPIREEWNGLLEPVGYGEYDFTASFLKPEANNVRLICLDISTLDSYGQEDVESENNTSCYSLVEDFFIASVFPSPAIDYVYADISVPKDGDVEISLVGRDGKELIKELFENTEAGTLRIKMDLRFLGDGLYILHAKFKDITDTYRFMKLKE